MKLDLITNNEEVTKGINPNDEFYTPNYAIMPLIKYLTPNSYVWCPFDLPESNFVKLLKENGHRVYHTHINEGKDFFKLIPPQDAPIDYIISNPPYSLKFEVFQRLFELNIPFAMLVGVVGLFESKKRFTMFANNNFDIMYLDKRVSYFKDYTDVKPKLNPPFSSVYLTKDILPERIVFEIIDKKGEGKIK